VITIQHDQSGAIATDALLDMLVSDAEGLDTPAKGEGFKMFGIMSSSPGKHPSRTGQPNIIFLE
jgi:hypothetical protein